MGGRSQLNLRCPESDVSEFRRAASEMGYGRWEFSQWVRDACRLYAGVLELEEAGEQQVVELRRELALLKRELNKTGGV